ncbi:904_t:CDS:2 [Ambispora gerdemannii]|uniref:904_t:CDS:1 n=1 Tax=Ambispora gerdemannii TaxID=144530 RepID=A0A9N9BBZ1_9GLOM|nr:904_t:CDS:2 [Ambispora gerdemannii]
MSISARSRHRIAEDMLIEVFEATSHTTISSAIRRHDRSEIDTTGRRSIFQVRGISYPPRRRAKSNKQNSQIENDENEIFEEVIRILESHIDGIEQKINVLTKSTIIQNSSEKISDKSNTKDSKFSELSTDELLKLTQNLGLLNNNYMEQNTELIEQQNEEQELKLQPRQFDFVFSWCNIPLNDFNIYSTSELGVGVQRRKRRSYFDDWNIVEIQWLADAVDSTKILYAHAVVMLQAKFSWF